MKAFDIRKVAIIFVMINLVSFGLCFLNHNIWYDETYTMALVRHSYVDIWSITANDVHPPLYYFIVRSCMLVLGFSLYAARILSLIPFLLLLLAGITKIRKMFGDDVSYLFLILCSALPAMLRLELEARMYMWAMLFVLLTGLYAYEAIESNRISKWLGLAFMSLLAAYTHYYALLAVAILYGLIFVVIMIRQRKLVLNWLLSGVMVLAGYFPWLTKLLGQMNKVSKDYWITKPTLFEIAKYIVYPFHIVEQLIPTLIAGILLLPLLVVIIINIRRNYKSKEALFGIITFMVLFLVIGVGILVSFLVKPVFVARYMAVTFGLVWLGMAIFLEKASEQSIKRILILLLSVLLLESAGQCVYENSNSFRQMEELSNSMDQDASIIVSDTHSLGIASYYFDHKIYALNNQEQLAAFEPKMQFASSEEILNMAGKYYYITADAKTVKGGFKDRAEWIQDIEIEDHIYHIYLIKKN